MKMECPLCKKYAGHYVTKTFAINLNLSGGHQAFFMDLAGRGISYRSRIRQCEACQGSFITVEIEKKFLTAFMEQLAKLENAHSFLNASNTACMEQNAQLQHENASLQSSRLQLEERVEAQQEQLAEITEIVHRTPAIP